MVQKATCNIKLVQFEPKIHKKTTKHRLTVKTQSQISPSWQPHHPPIVGVGPWRPTTAGMVWRLVEMTATQGS